MDGPTATNFAPQLRYFRTFLSDMQSLNLSRAAFVTAPFAAISIGDSKWVKTQTREEDNLGRNSTQIPSPLFGAAAMIENRNPILHFTAYEFSPPPPTST